MPSRAACEVTRPLAASSEFSMLSAAFSRCSTASCSSARPMPGVQLEQAELQRDDADQRERDQPDPRAPAERKASGQPFQRGEQPPEDALLRARALASRPRLEDPPDRRAGGP